LLDEIIERIWGNAKNALKIHIQEAEKKPDLASESILTNFTFQLDAEKQPSDTDEMYYILRDLQQQISKIPKSSAGNYVSPQERRIKAVTDTFPEHLIVRVTPGSSVPGCEKTHDCYDPNILEIKKGETILWLNEDNAAHTVTAGSATDGPSGEFDSSLFMSGNTFSHTFDHPGEFHYFDMVHTWMEAVILVT